MEPEEELPTTSGLLDMTTAITVAYVTGNQVAAGALPDTIRSIHDSLRQAEATPATPAPAALPAPAVRISKSVTDEFITCLDCGAKLRTLKRHLAVAHGLTIAQYRARWSLPGDYPAVAPSYTEFRSRTAKARGLGRAEPQQTKARGRGRKAS